MSKTRLPPDPICWPFGDWASRSGKGPQSPRCSRSPTAFSAWMRRTRRRAVEDRRTRLVDRRTEERPEKQSSLGPPPAREPRRGFVLIGHSQPTTDPHRGGTRHRNTQGARSSMRRRGSTPKHRRNRCPFHLSPFPPKSEGVDPGSVLAVSRFLYPDAPFTGRLVPPVAVERTHLGGVYRWSIQGPVDDDGAWLLRP